MGSAEDVRRRVESASEDEARPRLGSNTMTAPVPKPRTKIGTAVVQPAGTDLGMDIRQLALAITNVDAEEKAERRK